MKAFAVVFLLGLMPAGFLIGASDSQPITLDHKLQIPGATLKRGDYTFAIEDRLQDRAIIRITDSKNQSHELILAVPNEKLNQGEHGKLILFPTQSQDKQILEGWMCPSCQTALQVVYPKAEAVKITGVSAKPVLAVDPAYDKLPKNLTPDDMKVVTLWLLSPKEVTADQKGKGLEAAKWADVNAPKNTQTAEVTPSESPAQQNAKQLPAPVSAAAATPESPAPNPTPEPAVTPSAPVPDTRSPAEAQVAMPASKAVEPMAATAEPSTQVASLQTTQTTTRRMPHTASNMFNFGLAGLSLLGAGFMLRLRRRLQESRSTR